MNYINRNQVCSLTQDVHKQAEQEYNNKIKKGKKLLLIPETNQGCCHHKWNPKGKQTFLAFIQPNIDILTLSRSRITLLKKCLLFLSFHNTQTVHS